MFYNLDTRKFCSIMSSHPKIRTRWLYCRVMHPKDAEGIANSVDPDQIASLDSRTHPYPHAKEYINKVEMVQQRSARYVTSWYHNTSSVTSVLDHLEWESLESQRAKNQLIMLFIVDIPAYDYLAPASTRTRS